jgi:chemotaxis signal transduction protein
MNSSTQHQHQSHEQPVLFAGFYLGQAHFGIEAHLVQEVVYPGTITRVMNAPAEVVGIRNLRGHLVTVVDLSVMLGLGGVRPGADNRLLIMVDEGESFGFMVDRVTDVLRLFPTDIQPAPVNLGQVRSGCIRGVWRENHQLTALIDPAGLFSFSTGA